MEVRSLWASAGPELPCIFISEYFRSFLKWISAKSSAIHSRKPFNAIPGRLRSPGSPSEKSASIPSFLHILYIDIRYGSLFVYIISTLSIGIFSAAILPSSSSISFWQLAPLNRSIVPSFMWGVAFPMSNSHPDLVVLDRGSTESLSSSVHLFLGIERPWTFSSVIIIRSFPEIFLRNSFSKEVFGYLDKTIYLIMLSCAALPPSSILQAAAIISAVSASLFSLKASSYLENISFMSWAFSGSIKSSFLRSGGVTPDILSSIMMSVIAPMIPVFIMYFLKYINLPTSDNSVKIPSIKKFDSTREIFSILSLRSFSSAAAYARDSTVAVLKFIHPELFLERSWSI